MTFKIPHLPAPYTDEILGSWLRRIILRNGQKAFWRLLMHEVGPGGENISFFNVLPNNKFVCRLLQALESNYETALLGLTTFPYYAAFNPRPLPPTNAVFPHCVKGFPVEAYAESLRLARVNKQCMGVNRVARFCPMCVADDLWECGEPYWHRVHQLPTSFVCARHGVVLRTTCFRCGTAPYPRAEPIIGLPVLNCRCGADFRAVPQINKKLPEAFQVLAAFGLSILNAPLLGISLKIAKQTILNRSFPHAYPKLQYIETAKLLHSEYGLVKRGAVYVLPEEHQVSLDYPPVLRMSSNREMELTFLAACLFPTYTTLVSAAIKSASPRKEAKRFTWTRKTAVVMARRVISKAKEPNGQLKFLKTYGELYSALRILDDEWLQSMFPKACFPGLPTMAADRRRLNDVLTGHSTVTHKERHSIIHSMAAYRSSLRDVDWYQKFRRKVDARRPNQDRMYIGLAAKRRAETRHDLLAIHDREARDAIDAAIQTLLNHPGKPARINFRSILPLVGRPYSTTRRIILRDHGLWTAMRSAQDSYLERTIRWAVRNLQNAGEEVSIRKIRQLGKMSGDAESVELMRTIIREGPFN